MVALAQSAFIPLPVGRVLCLLVTFFFVGAISACSRFDYEIHSENFTADKPSQVSQALATLSVRYADDAKPYTMSVRDIPRGYALQAPLYEAPDERMESHLTISRSRELHDFVGIQSSWSF